MTSPKVLIVEDDYLIAMQAQITLEEAGFTIVGTAASADQAIEMAEAHQPALALMDIRLIGKRDGVDAALELFQRFGIRSVFASAHSDLEVRLRAEPARPLGWLSKPYSDASLVNAVGTACREIEGSLGQAP